MKMQTCADLELPNQQRPTGGVAAASLNHLIQMNSLIPQLSSGGASGAGSHDLKSQLAAVAATAAAAAAAGHHDSGSGSGGHQASAYPTPSHYPSAFMHAAAAQAAAAAAAYTQPHAAGVRAGQLAHSIYSTSRVRGTKFIMIGFRFHYPCRS